MSERVKFFNLSDDKLYYDERKKRFVFLEDAPEFVYKEVNNSHFKDVNPPPLRFCSKDLISLAKNKLNSGSNSSTGSSC